MTNTFSPLIPDEIKAKAEELEKQGNITMLVRQNCEHCAYGRQVK